MSMMINHHGGKCCGIKTIAGLCSAPDHTLWSFEGNNGKYLIQDSRGHKVSSEMNVYPYSRPKETAGERFDAYLDFLRTHRPCSLVEVTLVPYQWEAKIEGGGKFYSKDPWQLPWVKFLKDRGFNKVARFANCNSGNYVEVYHLILKDPDHDWLCWESPVEQEFQEDEDDDYYDEED